MFVYIPGGSVGYKICSSSSGDANVYCSIIGDEFYGKCNFLMVNFCCWNIMILMLIESHTCLYDISKFHPFYHLKTAIELETQSLEKAKARSNFIHFAYSP